MALVFFLLAETGGRLISFPVAATTAVVVVTAAEGAIVSGSATLTSLLLPLTCVTDVSDKIRPSMRSEISSSTSALVDVELTFD